MDNIMKFTIDKYNVIKDDDRFMVLETFIVSDGLNKHEVIISVEAMLKAMPTLANIPMICIFDEYGNDFTEHARSAYETRFKQRCVGSIPESHNAQIVEYAGRNFVRCEAIIWKSYAPQVAERFKENSNAPISMEIAVGAKHRNDDGILVIDNYVYHAISLLGDGVAPAIPNANVQVIKFSEDKYKDVIKQFSELYFNLNKEYKIPETVKYNAKKSLSKPQTNVALIKYAEKLSKSDIMQYDEVKWLYTKINNIKREDNIYFYGGVESKDWCSHIIENFEGGADALNNVKTNEIEETVEIIDEVEVIEETIEFAEDVTEELEDEIQVEEIVEETETTEEVNEVDNVEDDNPEEKFATKMDIFAMLADVVEEEKDEYGWYVCMMMDFDDGYAYAYDCGKDSYVKMPYTMEGEAPVVSMEEKVEVYRTSNWVDKPESNYKEKYSEVSSKLKEFTEKITEATNELATAKDEKSEVDGKFNELEGKYADLLKVEKELIEFKENALKEQKQEFANNLYKEFDEFLSEDEVEEFNAQLFSYGEFAEFEKAFKASILPKVVAKYNANPEGVSEDKTNKIDAKILQSFNGGNGGDKASPKSHRNYVDKLNSLNFSSAE